MNVEHSIADLRRRLARVEAALAATESTVEPGTNLGDLATKSSELLQRDGECGPDRGIGIDYVSLERTQARMLFRDLGGTWSWPIERVEGVQDHIGVVGAKEVGVHGVSPVFGSRGDSEAIGGAGASGPVSPVGFGGDR